MAGFLQRGLLIYVLMVVAMVFAAPQYVFSGDTVPEKTVLGWFDMGYNSVTGEVTMNETWNTQVVGDDQTKAFTSPSSPAGAQGILGFVDVLFQVWEWVKLIFKVIFCPFMLFGAVGMPWQLTLFLALPLVVLFIVGLLTFIRSGFT